MKLNPPAKENSLASVRFERAIFLSWYCSKGDCKFCYMSTQKDRIKDPKRARRSFESIFAEAMISKQCGWGVEFISGGYDSFSTDELLFIVSTVYEITGKKQWLNLGTLDEKELLLFKPYAEGFAGTVECVNWKLRKEICPSKPIDPIIRSFEACDRIGLKKAMTLIIGLGETIDDFSELKRFILKHRIDRITFYALNPQKGTPYTKSPDINYYSGWIARTRESFPDLYIIAGAWHDKTHYFSRLLEAGADSITKFPAIRYFGKKEAEEIGKECRLAGRRFTGTLTKLPDADWDKLVDGLSIDRGMKEKVKKKIRSYVLKMAKT